MSDNYFSSTEFIALCQSQITILSKSLGAVWSVIYLTEEMSEDGQAQLFPLAIYPQNKNKNVLELPAVKLSEFWQQFQSHSVAQLLPANLTSKSTKNQSASNLKSGSEERKQLIVPLIHQDTFFGLLVTGREDREWQSTELKQIEEITRTIAIARFLELQYHWTKEELTVQKNLQRIERDRLDDLLHQLRNPLTALRTFGKLLIKRLLPGDDNRKIAQSILEQSDRFQQLLEQFETESNAIDSVDLEEFDRRKTPVLEASDRTVAQGNFLLPSSNQELDSLDLQQILEPLLNAAKAIATDRNIKLITNIPSIIPKVRGDISALREIFNNLIDNALKYTPAGGKIQLDLKTKQFSPELKMLGMAISDTGYGIPIADRERIFERHYRGIQAKSDIPGTGLGLAIAQELIVKMQGEIELISPNNLSKDSPGTTLVVWLTIINES